MLLVEVGRREGWNVEKQEFEYTSGKTYSLEHSLWSIAQWETIYRKPFLNTQEFTVDQFQTYLNLMSKDGPIDVIELDPEMIDRISEYINDSLTATVIKEIGNNTPGASYTTSETLYATMTIARIPWEAQYWHLSRLITLIRVINEFTGEKKKMTPQEILEQNRELNRQRREQLKTKG